LLYCCIAAQHALLELLRRKCGNAELVRAGDVGWRLPGSVWRRLCHVEGAFLSASRLTFTGDGWVPLLLGY
jgi:hypothetical protein